VLITAAVDEAHSTINLEGLLLGELPTMRETQHLSHSSQYLSFSVCLCSHITVISEGNG
jgi:hypothetical protein